MDAKEASAGARNGWVSKALLVKTCLFGFVAASLALFSTTASSPLPDVTDGGARRLGAAGLAPLLGDGSAVDWWFAFKLTTSAFPTCSAKPTCAFGGKEQTDGKYGLQYVLSYGSKGKTNAMQLHTDCLGNADDPLAKTFNQVYSGQAPNFVVWNDQFYGDPVLNTKPKCTRECEAPWGHSKGVLAWGDDGTGFVLQVTTPDWPGAGSKAHPRTINGNTLGCCYNDDNTKVAQHFFALHLATKEDTLAVLQSMQRASVATDPNNPQVAKLTSGPSELLDAAKQLGHQVKDIVQPLTHTMSVRTSKSPVQLLAKPSGLSVSPWHMVSSMLQTPLRTATWWAHPTIPSSKANYKPGCWNSVLKSGGVPEVQAAITGQWASKTFSFKGEPTTNGNHAKVAHSLSGKNLAVFGDMNMQGALDPSDGGCDSAQNGRGGMFFVLEDDVLHEGLKALLTGDTAPYKGGSGPGPSPTPPSPPTPPTPPSPPTPPAPPSSCGGAGIDWRKCKASGCKYVKSTDAKKCQVAKFGCYDVNQLPDACKNANQSVA